MSLFIILFVVTMAYISTTSRFDAYVKILQVQGILLFCMVLAESMGMEKGTVVFLLIETLFFKTLVIPWFLNRILRKNSGFREVKPTIPHLYSLMVCSLFMVFGFVIAVLLMRNYLSIKPLYFGVSVSTIMTGFFIILTRKQLFSHVVGYMMMENGIFLLSLSVAAEMPFVVNAGVLLDIFVALYVLGLFSVKIQTTLEESSIDMLTDLKD
ncbi:MAG: hypothetical protein PHE58_06155 [Candidatus Omnitrophica bacterium]|nr:hypothetical protein [Candidatus Omnitrophota bacterium]